jgi:hypothetical protein
VTWAFSVYPLLGVTALALESRADQQCAGYIVVRTLVAGGFALLDKP